MGFDGWRVGTVGFSYQDWIGKFYPKGLSQRGWLRFYAERYDCVEIDSTFYGVPRAETVRRWAEDTPEGFRFILKAPQALTHVDISGRMGSAEGRLVWDEFVSVATGLGRKLRAVLVQFPPDYGAGEVADLEQFVLGARVPLVLEFRHRSWWSEAVIERVRGWGVCWAVSDRPRAREVWEAPDGAGVPFPDPVVDVADWIFLRFVGRHNQFPNREDFADATRRLLWWADQVSGLGVGGREVVAVFSNGYNGFAPDGARIWRERWGLAGPGQLDLFGGSADGPRYG